MIFPGSVKRVTVGATVPTLVSSGAVSFARPKSRIFTKPSRLTMMFSGLRSRCTIPAACARASPSATCAEIASRRFTGSAPWSRRSRSVFPSTSSIAM